MFFRQLLTLNYECFSGSLKILWRTTCGPVAANCPPLI